MKNKTVILIIAIVVIVGAFFIGMNAFKSSDNTNSDQSADQQATNAPSGKTADYTNRGLTAFPNELLDQTELTLINLENNQIDGSLPGEIKQLINLEQLLVSNNRMTGIPAEIGQMKSLKKIDFSNNRITGLPMELGNLTQLEVLDLRGNNIPTADQDQIRNALTGTQVQF